MHSFLKMLIALLSDKLSCISVCWTVKKAVCWTGLESVVCPRWAKYWSTCIWAALNRSGMTEFDRKRSLALSMPPPKNPVCICQESITWSAEWTTVLIHVWIATLILSPRRSNRSSKITINSISTFNLLRMNHFLVFFPIKNWAQIFTNCGNLGRLIYFIIFPIRSNLD